MYSHNGLPFSTFDVDNDNRSTAILFGPNLGSIYPKHLTERLCKDLFKWHSCQKRIWPQLKYISGMESLQKEVVPDCTRSTLWRLVINQTMVVDHSPNSDEDAMIVHSMTVWYRAAGGTATAMTQTWTVSDCSTLRLWYSTKSYKTDKLSLAAPSDIDISSRTIICPTTVKISNNSRLFLALHQTTPVEI